MRYAAGRDEAGRTIPVADPLSERLAAIGSGAGGDAAALAAGFLGVREVFGDDLPVEPRFTGGVTVWLRSLMERGARATVAACVAG
jgi:fructuronate reductase